METEENRASPSWSERRHERFTLLARGEEKLRELIRSGQLSDAAAVARQGWSKLVEAVRATTPASLADHLREALGERPRASGDADTAAASETRASGEASRAAEPRDDDTDVLRRLRAVELGYPVFVKEGGSACGAVREIHFGATPTLTIHVENAGEFAVSARAVRAAHDGKVVLDEGLLDPALRNAIGHAHDAEQPGL